MPKYWMISNRAVKNGIPSRDYGPLKFYVSDQGPLDNFNNWKAITQDAFGKLLKGAADQFQSFEHGDNEKQSHVTFFVHGYNNKWDDVARRYERFCKDLFDDQNSGLGICISFDWPSFGSVTDYLPDREHARESANDLADVLCELYDWLIDKQKAAADDPQDACKAKVSLVSHSMGNYVLQKAMAVVWTRKNQPLLVSLINQLVMVAADVDNDLFEPTSSDGTDGNAIANLTYRITALYSGRDGVLGASAGLKHFGTRRLGRSGLSVRPPTGKDNVWDIDCSSFFPVGLSSMQIHSAYFDQDGTVSLMKSILQGVDRSVLVATEKTNGNLWPKPV